MAICEIGFSAMAAVNVEALPQNDLFWPLMAIDFI